MIRRFFRWLSDFLEEEVHVSDPHHEALQLEIATLRHLAESLEKERDAARAELKSMKAAHGQLAHYGVAARQEALAAHHHLSRFLCWAQPPAPTTGGDRK